VREVDLGLMARRRLEADDRLGRRQWTDLTNECLQLRVAARVPGGPDLREQPYGRQLRIGREPRRNDSNEVARQ
jgi:hypothetical protein